MNRIHSIASGKNDMRLIIIVIGLLFVTVWACSLAAQDQRTGAAAGNYRRTDPAERMAPALSLKRSAELLDAVAVDWTRQRKCGTCHTNYPYLMARPALKEFSSPAMAEVRGFFENRVAHWDDPDKGSKPRWDTEVVATAAALAINDSATTGTLHPLTRRALDRMWTLQRPDGGWDWLKCDWPPYEHDDYYGAIVAALGAGHAPGDYSRSQSAQRGLDRLRSYFRNNPPPDLHHQAMLLWASTRLDGLMEAARKEATIQALRQRQRSDGGWNLPSLGHWRRHDGTANDSNSSSDGYATGLVVFVIRQAGVPATDPAILRGVAWLKANQRASGRWFTRSLSNDKAHYISNAGTGFVVMALRACGISGTGDLTQSTLRTSQAGVRVGF
jgi:squalene-hopene/tetraprenyl-beta-curcumene cyclase